jgi:hypothetical protein
MRCNRSDSACSWVNKKVGWLQAGEEWAKGIQNAVLSCQAMVVLCSETYGATPWTFREISLADNERKPLVAVWHSGSFPPHDVKIILGTHQRVPRGNNPLTHPSVDFDAAVKELVEALRRKNVLPETPPPPPPTGNANPPPPPAPAPPAPPPPSSSTGGGSEAEAEAVFKQWDRNGDGVLDANEILIGCLHLGMDPEDVSALFARLDVNGDGEVSLEEWRVGYAAFRVIGTPADALCDWLKQHKLEKYEAALREDMGAVTVGRCTLTPPVP